jgi:signal transduction histidine kinase
MRRFSWVLTGRVAGWLAIGVCISVGLLSWFGYHAILEWRRSSLLVADRRASEAADLLLEALTHDMHGVQQTVLTSQQWNDFAADRPYEISNLVASTFARYPYPESFFAWRGEDSPDSFVFFNRSDRRPPWLPGKPGPSRFPVVIERAPATAGVLQTRIRRDASRGRRFSAFELTLHGVDYQIVSQLSYQDPFRERLLEAAGFMVNLDWVRAHYFSELARQVSEIGGGAQAGLDLVVSDPAGRTVAGTRPSSRPELINQRPFALTFFDPLVVTPDPPDKLAARWNVEVSAANDPTLAQAISGANRTLAIGAASALALAIGLVLTARAERASAKLTELRSEFVSTVTHELKTPIATIRAAAETLSGGRLTGIDTFQAYGRLVVVEAKRLTRLVENLLAYSRITDIADIYTFEPIDVGEFVEDIQREFQGQLTQFGFDLQVDIPPGTPPVRGDRLALRLLFDNLIDNSIRYSDKARFLRLSAHREDGHVTIGITDSGIGIPAEEISQVTRKFFRGRKAPSGGSGLGLAIASRIASDHGGTLSIRSVVGEGTTVSVTLPASQPA